MHGKVTAMVGLGMLAFAPAVFAQYNLELTGIGNGTVADGVYVSPYQGTVQGPGVNYAGFMICDDFNTESYLNTPWTASTTNAGALNGSEKFTAGVTFDGVTYSAAQSYDAAAWLANQLLANLNNRTAQTNYAFAIWNVFDGAQNDPAGGAAADEKAAFAAVRAGYVGSNVSVYTPTGTPGSPVKNINASQEFLVVTAAPEIDPATAASGFTLLLGGILVLRSRRRNEIR
jgi:hypothetical protein